MEQIQQLLHQNTKPSQWTYRKIRQISKNNLGPNFGITIPKTIAYHFLNIKMTILHSGNAIILQASGVGVKV